MENRVITADRKPATEKEKRRLSMELAEIGEISEILFKKLEMKLQAVQVLEASIDKKKAALEQLILRAEALEKGLAAHEEASSSVDEKAAALVRMVQHAETLNAQAGTNRRQEIVALNRKGLAQQEIAEVLDMPQGEVELILELNTVNA